ncbi:MAG TPA: hypothetical protein DDZ51_19695 [Planctomycetaceae bacterium]|nr:hypothetical protein [Planctomycetaceae bacterium]
MIAFDSLKRTRKKEVGIVNGDSVAIDLWKPNAMSVPRDAHLGIAWSYPQFHIVSGPFRRWSASTSRVVGNHC